MRISNTIQTPSAPPVFDQVEEIIKDLKENIVFGPAKDELEKLINQESQTFLTELEQIFIIVKAAKEYFTTILATDKKSVEAEKQTDETRNNILLITKLVFALRKFFTDESLNFVIGGTIEENNLGEKRYTQDELFGNFDNFRISFSNMQIELSQQAEALSSEQKFKGDSLLAQWSKILNWGFMDYNEVKNNEKAISLDAGKRKKKIIYKYYLATNPDMNVVARWQQLGDARSFQHYYFMDESRNITKASDFRNKAKLLAYDRGWLYQWIKIKEQENESELVLDENSQTPLKPIFQGSVRENLQGIKGGDAGLNQLKYGNRRIITIKNILTVLTKLEAQLNNFQALLSDETKLPERLEAILTNFMDEKNSIVKSKMEEKVTALMKILTQKN